MKLQDSIGQSGQVSNQPVCGSELPVRFCQMACHSDFLGQPADILRCRSAIFIGVRRAFAPDRRKRSSIASIVTRSLPRCWDYLFSPSSLPAMAAGAHGRRKSGRRRGISALGHEQQSVSLPNCLVSNQGKPAKGVLLIFYRATGDLHVTPSCGAFSRVWISSLRQEFDRLR